MAEYCARPLSPAPSSSTWSMNGGKTRRQDGGRRSVKSPLSSVSPASLPGRYNHNSANNSQGHSYGVIGSGVGANRRSGGKNIPDYKKPRFRSPPTADIAMADDLGAKSADLKPSHMSSHILPAPLLDSLNLPPPAKRSYPSAPPGLSRPAHPIRPAPAIPSASWHKLGISAPEYLHLQRQRNPHMPRVMSLFNPDRAFLPKVFLSPPPKYSHNRLPAYKRPVYQWDDVEEKWQTSGKHIRSTNFWLWQSPGQDDTWVPSSQRDQNCMQWRNPHCATCQHSSSMRNRAMVAAAVANERLRMNLEAAALTKQKEEEGLQMSSGRHRFAFNSSNAALTDCDNDQEMMNIVEHDTSRTSLADEMASAAEAAMVEVSSSSCGHIGESPVPKTTLASGSGDIEIDCPPTPRPKLLDSFDDFDEDVL